MSRVVNMGKNEHGTPVAVIVPDDFPNLQGCTNFAVSTGTHGHTLHLMQKENMTGELRLLASFLLSDVGLEDLGRAILATMAQHHQALAAGQKSPVIQIEDRSKPKS